jgi:hypothetical protein
MWAGDLYQQVLDEFEEAQWLMQYRLRLRLARRYWKKIQQQRERQEFLQIGKTWRAQLRQPTFCQSPPCRNLLLPHARRRGRPRLYCSTRCFARFRSRIFVLRKGKEYMSVKKQISRQKKAQQIAALTKVPQTSDPIAIASHASESFKLASGIIARLLGGPLTPRQLAPVFVAVREEKKLMEDLEHVARARALEKLKGSGKVATDKGTMRLEADGWLFEARPHRSGTDPKKLEALLRAKELAIEAWMDATVSYVVNKNKLSELIRTKHLTEAELATCNYDESWTVLTPKKATEAGEEESDD